MENGLMDLVAEPEFAMAFLERLTDTIITAQTCYLKEVGDLIDIHFTADDFTGQKGPFISPAIYRRMVKPLWARITAAIKRHTKAKIFYHGCGAIEPFLPDLIEIGIDIINPVQVSAAGMDTAMLKKKYGKKWPIGWRLRHAESVAARHAGRVRAETQKRIRDLARAAASSSIQSTIFSRSFPSRTLWRCSIRQRISLLSVVLPSPLGEGLGARARGSYKGKERTSHASALTLTLSQRARGLIAQLHSGSRT